MSDIKTGTSCHNDDSCGDYLQCVMVDEKTKTYKQCSGKMCGRPGDPKGVCYPFQKAGQVDVTNASKIAKKTAEKSKANIALIVGRIGVGVLITGFILYKVRKHINKIRGSN
jgi:hypothetical protein